ncbi:YjfB family protein [Lederbergia sp. NSJ-179]|uniref:YjfB family protein n=1 Tax=Lederbergia sp. NSJ-179 TaxID=2931402 RepID=UPI001FD0C840|nr:YjfB family protein [Lederbergia sp. NSJ-179]MCJ7840153.1 YjfB family protein [Lederbergia sp. NSJ-179]
MDIAGLSMALNQVQLQQQASILVTKKVMEMTGEQGEAIKTLLESAHISAIQHAAQPHLGSHIDLTR